MVTNPRVVAVPGPAVEPLDRRFPVVEQDDFAEARPAAGIPALAEEIGRLKRLIARVEAASPSAER